MESAANRSSINVLTALRCRIAAIFQRSPACDPKLIVFMTPKQRGADLVAAAPLLITEFVNNPSIELFSSRKPLCTRWIHTERPGSSLLAVRVVGRLRY